jgi:hypothetical protein
MVNARPQSEPVTSSRHRRRSTAPISSETAAKPASAESWVPLEWHFSEGEAIGYTFEKLHNLEPPYGIEP